METKNKETYESKKMKLVYGLIRFYIGRALRYGEKLDYEPKVGEWVYEVSSIYPRKGKKVFYQGIGKLLKQHNNHNNWLIENLNGTKTTWNNADFYRLPDEVQELLTNSK